MIDVVRRNLPPVVILAGGLGTRMAEETHAKPKPLVEIGGQPVIWHIMKQYAHYGHQTFQIALGYKGEAIKRYFMDYVLRHTDMRIELGSGNISSQVGEIEDWTVSLFDTGQETATGGRLRRLEQHLKQQTFMVTYGDGVSDVNIRELLDFHRTHQRVATLTAVRPPARFGRLRIENDCVTEFQEKPQSEDSWINGGYFVFEPAIFDYIDGDHTSLEFDVLHRLAAAGQLAAYRHDRFWQCMDTLREKRLLERLWHESPAPWKVWA